jgi:hypothetical protein
LEESYKNLIRERGEAPSKSYPTKAIALRTAQKIAEATRTAPATAKKLAVSNVGTVSISKPFKQDFWTYKLEYLNGIQTRKAKYLFFSV